jgi:Peroxiredoxin
MRSDDLYSLPPDLPIPVDDGSCDHLAGLLWPSVPLRSTLGTYVSLAAVNAEWLVVYCYPRTGLPNQIPPGGLAAWDGIPGARGCTPQACSYCDHHAELVQHSAHVLGVSTQDTEDQREVVDRLTLLLEKSRSIPPRFLRCSTSILKVGKPSSQRSQEICSRR